MSTEIKNLELVYERFYQVSLQIGELIDRELYEELAIYVNKKDKLLSEAAFWIEKLKNKNEDVKIIEEIWEKIKKQELTNLNSMTRIRDNIKKELNKTSKSQKLVSAYANTEYKQGSILDCNE